MRSRFSLYLTAPIGGQVLGFFRVFYSLFMALEMIYYLQIDLVKNMFVLPSVNFKYDGLAWIKPMPEIWMNALIWALLLLSLLMAAGIWFKWAARLFAIGNAYILLQDTSLYNNHIYFFILLAWMLSCTHADQFFSFRKRQLTAIPRWEQFIIQFQIVIVYFFAGVIKLKYDWLFRQEPVRSLCTGLDSHHWLAPLIKNEAAIHILTYGGLLLDLASPLLLSHKPLRKWAIFLFIGFHLFNINVFQDIQFFPFVMLGALIIFYEPSELKWLNRWRKPKTKGHALNNELPKMAPLPAVWVQKLLIAYFIFQLLFPLRGFLLPNQMDWTTIGNRFSWRVKADSRGIDELDFQVFYIDGSVAKVNVNSFINSNQIRMVVNDPRAVCELAQAIKAMVTRQGGSVMAVKARIKLRYNGRPAQYFVDPDADLTKVKYSPFQVLDWVVPVR